MKLTRAREAPPYRPPARGLAHDLRRGLFRALPYLVLCGFVIAHSPVDGVTAATAVLVWVPITLLEGALSRRPPARRELLIALAGSWMISTLWIVGCYLQWQYVAHLARSSDPAAAFASIHLPRHRLEELLATALVVAVITSGHTVCRLLLRNPDARHGAMVGIPLLQLFLLAGVAGLLDFLTRGRAASAVGSFVMSGAVLTLICAPSLVIAFIGTTLTDSLELRLWPEDA